MPNVHYDFFICDWDDANIMCSTTDMISSFPKDYCFDITNTTKEYESKRQPIPTDVGNRVVQMYIC